MKRTGSGLIAGVLVFLVGCCTLNLADAASAPLTQVDPSLLALPGRNWTDYNMSENGPVDAAGASRGPFATNHGSTYQALGMQTGYQEGGTWPTFETIHYLASAYGSLGDASKAFADGQTHTGGIAGAASQACKPMPLPWFASCAEYTYSGPAGAQVTYVAAQVGTCLVEVEGFPPPDSTLPDFSPAQSDVQATAYEALPQMHVACPTGVPAPPQPKTGPVKTCTSKIVSKKVKGKTKHVKVQSCTTVYSLYGTLGALGCGGGYDTENASVVIRDENNKVIGATTTSAEDHSLEAGTLDCVVSFSVTVPKANYYQIQIGTHSGTPYTFAQMQQVNWYLKLTL